MASRSLGRADRPYRLLSAVEGLELRELPGADQCCGFGGTFAVKNPDVSVDGDGAAGQRPWRLISLRR